MLSTACEELSEHILKHSFLKCGILNALDGSQDNAIWADIPVEISGEDLNQDDCLEDDVDDLDPFSDDEDTN